MDPRHVLTDVRGRLHDLKLQLDDAVRTVREVTYSGLTDDLVDVLSLPISTIEDAVKKIGIDRRGG
jgi:hypothetical protein